MAETILKSSFPSQIASDVEKASLEYGLKVARAVEHEWFKRDSGATRFFSNRDEYHRLRLYARGEQSVKKYKDELSINGDLSYLNLDWKPVPIIPKFVDIVVNGMSDRLYDIKAFSQDPASVKQRTDYVESVVADMQTKEISDQIQKEIGVNMYSNDKSKLPDNEDELSLHMQLEYKQAIEIAEEQAINSIFNSNNYDLTQRRINYDLAVIGIGAIKNEFNTAEGIKLKYVDPADLVYSYTHSPYFDDIYYIGEVRSVTINELKQQFPNLTDDELKNISQQGVQTAASHNRYVNEDSVLDANTIQILYFNYKTYNNQVFKIKKTATGADKAIAKSDQFNPPADSDLFTKQSRSLEVVYDGAFVLGTKKMLKWEIAKNMVRPKSDTTKVMMNYSVVAPRIYKGRIESLVGRITGFADMIQLTHLKLQQVMARMIPDGVYLDADGLAEIDLGNGTNYNPQEALNMFFQTGSVIGRSMTQEGDMNPGKVPIQELTSNGGNNKMSSLINTYNYYLQMIRDVTGLNEARDGSVPDKNALVGVQKLAAANSNTATRHILQSSLFLTAKTAEAISLRISDVLEFSPTRESFVSSIGRFNVATLDDIKNMHLHDFGIYIELAPDEEEKQKLENNIQQALAKDQIYLEDAIDVREIKNIKLANQLLKVRRKKKLELDQQNQQQNIQAQADANSQNTQVAAQMEIQKNEAITNQKVQLAEMEANLELQKMEQEKNLKKELMSYEFELNIALKDKENETFTNKEKFKEDRKDERTRIQATQQSKLIEQRKDRKGEQEFESAGNDTMGSGFNLEQFEPR
ncbi:MAG: hypothetical protein CBC24_00335 [Candidatus Pelagibacter sp. TMED64]|nr:MAG: hypothetical protein CBC24_00335 [Candidatus Pelagibacter sp. TMED64]